MADFDVTIVGAGAVAVGVAVEDHVGAGAVGLACGYSLARRGQSVVVLERENRIGAGISSRNSASDLPSR